MTRLEAMVIPKDQDEAVKFSTLIAPIDFIIPDKFNIVEPKSSLPLVQPDVFQELQQLSSTIVLILEHFKTRDRVFSTQWSMM